VRDAPAPTPGADPAASLRDLARMAAGLIAGAGTPRLQGIAVGVPGYVTADRRTVRLASNLPGWRDLAVAAAFEQALGAPCILDNDVNMAAIGEGCFGAARGIRDYIFLDLGTGIGAGVVIGGQVHRGVHGLGGELALSAVVGEDGQLRSIEADTAGWSLTEHAHRLGYADVPALFRAAESGDDAATQTLEHAARCLALAVSNMCAVVDPALVVVGGGLVKGSDLFLDAMRAVLADRLPYPPRVARTRLADRAAVLGAATVALDTFSGVPISTGGVAG
jgi:predicted NBD/HSP70 family sugar kinase